MCNLYDGKYIDIDNLNIMRCYEIFVFYFTFKLLLTRARVLSKDCLHVNRITNVKITLIKFDTLITRCCSRLKYINSGAEGGCEYLSVINIFQMHSLHSDGLVV